MTVNEYFQLPDAPMKDSPVGALMVRILNESPELSFEHARTQAHLQLAKAAGRRRFKVTTPAQDRANLESFRRRARDVPKTGEAAA